MAKVMVLDPRPENLDVFDRPLIVLVDGEELDAQIHIDIIRHLGDKSMIELRKEMGAKRFKSGTALLVQQQKGTVIYIPTHGVMQSSLHSALDAVVMLGQKSAYLVYPAKVNLHKLKHMVGDSYALIEVILVRDRSNYAFS